MKHFFQNRIKDYQFPAWLNLQSVILIFVLLIFLSIFLWSDPLAEMILPPTNTPTYSLSTPTILPGTPTPLPQEYMQTDQTNSIIMGGAVLVMVVVGGTIGIILRRKS